MRKFALQMGDAALQRKISGEHHLCRFDATMAAGIASPKIRAANRPAGEGSAS
jgi:hypothetical protein